MRICAGISGGTIGGSLLNLQRRHKSDLERVVAEQYRQAGYDVIVEPSKGDLPFDLGGYIPDLLLSTEDGEHLIVEVKRKSSGIPVEKFRDIAEIVSGEPGWKFLLVTADSPAANMRERSPLTLRQVQRLAEQASTLRSHGGYEASILTLWSVLEAVMRNRAEETHLPVEGLQTSSLVNHLYSQGELSMEQFDAISDLGKTRNLLAHGFQADDLSGASDRLSELVSELIDDWR